MIDRLSSLGPLGAAWIVAACLAAGGCHLTSENLGIQNDELAAEDLLPSAPGFAGLEGGEVVPAGASLKQLPPTELRKVSLPAYRIEPPDVLLIDAIRMAPKAPYFIQTLDILQINVAGTLQDQPIAGTFQVDPSGVVVLGPSYGSVKVVGMSISDATDAITRRLSKTLTKPEVSVTLLQQSGQQQIAGEHMVGPDGAVNLGVYGSVYVSGMTLAEARAAIEEHLSASLDSPKVSLDVFAYNSKVYYVILEGAGLGDRVFRVPVTGNETVLDAIAGVGGFQQFSSNKMWISRPAPSGVACDQILPVDYAALTKGAATATNYQLLPGDRLFIAQDRLVWLDSFVQKVSAPFERVFGFALLGSQTIQSMQRFPKGFTARGF